MIRDVEPGELLVLDEMVCTRIALHHRKHRKALCAMEYIYFARPDSDIEWYEPCMRHVNGWEASWRWKSFVDADYGYGGSRFQHLGGDWFC